MEVLKVETESGTLLKYIFHTEAEETQADLKQKVKDWLVTNTSISWEDFYDRVSTINSNRITLDMS